MKRLLSLLTFITSITINNAQQVQFEQIFPQPPAPQLKISFCDFSNSSIAYADIDGDQDQDILISGFTNNGIVANLYINDGNGNFEVADSGITGIQNGDMAFADIDNDNDMDLLITGFDKDYTIITKLYTNDGNGNFSEQTNTGFPNIAFSTVAFADIDNDSDMDLLIIGSDDNSDILTKLYTNDGNGNFTEKNQSTIVNVSNGDITFGDIDNDHDLDVLITGTDTNNDRSTKLYKNDGNGNFTETTGSQFVEVAFSSTGMADIDNDNDLDILITGYGMSGAVSKLYTNDGNGNFTEIASPLINVNYSSIAFDDIDNNNTIDVILMGTDENYHYSTKLYANDGTGNFTEVTNDSLTGAYNGEIAFVDINNDNLPEIIITGSNQGKLFFNQGNKNFIHVTGTPFENFSESSVAIADIDNDGNQDILITGKGEFWNVGTKLYKNNGNDNFSEVSNSNFVGVINGEAEFTDIDNDNDSDLIIVGENSDPVTKLYVNDGTGNFTEINTNLPPVKYASVAFSDVDNDQDQDVFICGKDANKNVITALYLNDGTGNFIESTNNTFKGIIYGDIQFADIDNDNDQDVLVVGSDENYNHVATLYLNDGNGNFTEKSGNNLYGIFNNSCAIGDIDNDNDMDILIDNYLFLNDGDENFSLDNSMPFSGVLYSSVLMTDIDNDNDLDVLICGITGMATDDQTTCNLYINDGLGNFTTASDIPFVNIYKGDIGCADFNNDGKKDIFITGLNCKRNSYLYKNTTNVTDISNYQEQISQIYPNPTNGIIHLNFDNLTTKDIQLFNIQGQKIAFEFNQNTHELSVKSSKGIYILKINKNGQKYSQKIILH